MRVSRLQRRVGRLVIRGERRRHEPRHGEFACLYGDSESDGDERGEQHEEVEKVDEEVRLKWSFHLDGRHEHRCR